MKRLIGWGGLFVVLAAFPLLPWLALDDAPAIEPPAQFRRTDLAWIKSLFEKHDPRGQTPDVVQSIQLDEARPSSTGCSTTLSNCAASAALPPSLRRDWPPLPPR